MFIHPEDLHRLHTREHAELTTLMERQRRARHQRNPRPPRLLAARHIVAQTVIQWWAFAIGRRNGVSVTRGNAAR